MHILYGVALSAVLLVSSPWWIWRILRAGKYRSGLPERLGRVPSRLGTAEGAIWVHAVSVGEVLAVTSMLSQLRERIPGRRIVVSTTTMTGQALARERFGADNVFYFPLDFASTIRPYLSALRPSLVILAEAEFWPNFLRLARKHGARIAVVNARISDRSFPRYRRFRAFFAGVLDCIDLFLAQTEQDSDRLVAIGAAPERVRVAGNLKFDVKPPAQTAIVNQLRNAMQRGGATHVIVAGSTLEGEEDLLLDAFEKILAAYPRAVLLLAPRHPERFPRVVELVAKRDGLRWNQRSKLAADAAVAGGVLVLDSVGELAAVYQLATLSFVGGSLVPAGGHNVVEPARFGVPIVVGRHTDNFREMVEIFARAKALRIVQPSELTAEFLSLLANEPARLDLGRRAAALVEHYSGATSRSVDAIVALLPDNPSPLLDANHTPVSQFAPDGSPSGRAQ